MYDIVRCEITKVKQHSWAPLSFRGFAGGLGACEQAGGPASGENPVATRSEWRSHDRWSRPLARQGGEVTAHHFTAMSCPESRKDSEGFIFWADD